MRVLKQCSRPRYRPLDTDTVQRNGFNVQVQRFIAAPYGDIHFRFLHGTLEFAEGRYDLVVDGQDYVTVFQLIFGRSPCNQPRDAECTSFVRIVLFEFLQPRLVHTEFACREQWRVTEFDLERINGLPGTHEIHEFIDQFAGNTAVELPGITTGLVGKARPLGHDFAFPVDQHAVNLARRIDQGNRLQVRISETHGARQRQTDRLDGCHRAGLMDKLVVAHQSYYQDIFSDFQLVGRQRGGPGRRIPDQFRVVADHCKIVQRMNVFDLAVYLQRTGKCNCHVTHGNGNSVAVDNHVSAFLVDDEAGAVIVPVGNAGYRIRQVERDHDERRCDGVDAPITVAGELGAARLGRRRFGPGAQVLAGPDTGLVVAHAITNRKPGSIHFDGAHDAVSRVFDRIEADIGTVAVGQSGEFCFQFRDVIDGLAANFGNYRAARYRRARQDIARVCNVDAAYRVIVMPRLLIREIVHDCVAEFEKLVWRDLVKVVYK